MIDGKVSDLFTHPLVQAVPVAEPGQLLIVALVPLRLIVVVPVKTCPCPLFWASLRSWVLETVPGSWTDFALGFAAGVVPWNFAL
jgi:hypothetical protein